jgi:hypothetical protein
MTTEDEYRLFTQRVRAMREAQRAHDPIPFGKLTGVLRAEMDVDDWLAFLEPQPGTVITDRATVPTDDTTENAAPCGSRECSRAEAERNCAVLVLKKLLDGLDNGILTFSVTDSAVTHYRNVKEAVELLLVIEQRNKEHRTDTDTNPRAE